MLRENLTDVEKNICAACEKAARSREDVTLIAVSKTKPKEMLMEIYDCNIRQFGEFANLFVRSRSYFSCGVTMTGPSGPPRAVATPCVMVCAVDGESGLCLGCFRTLREIACWRGS